MYRRFYDFIPSILSKFSRSPPIVRLRRDDGWRVALRGPLATGTLDQGVQAVVVDANGFVKVFEGRRVAGEWSTDAAGRRILLDRIAAGCSHDGFLDSFVFGGGSEFAWRRDRFDPVDHRLPPSDRTSKAYRESIAWAFEDEPVGDPLLADRIRDSVEGPPLSCKVHALFHRRDPQLLPAATARPWLVRLPLPHLGRVQSTGRPHDPAAIAAALTAYENGAWPVDARAVERFDAKPKTLRMLADPTVFLSLLSHLPPEWIAAMPGGAADLAEIVPFLKPFLPEGVSGARDLLKGCAGRPDLFVASVLEGGPNGDRIAAMGEISDFLDFVGHRLVFPFAGHMLAHDIAVLSILRLVSKRLVTPDGNLRRLREKSDLWHRDPTACDPAGPDLDWPAILPVHKHGRIEIVPLLSDAELRDEGRAMAHCVGTFGGRCAAGTSFVHSVRRRVRGGFERLSTVELRRSDENGSLEIAQHLAARNRAPSEDAEKAVAVWMARVSSGRIRIDPAADAWHAERRAAIPTYGDDHVAVDPAAFRGLILPAYAAMDAPNFAIAAMSLVADARAELGAAMIAAMTAESRARA